MIEKNAGSHIEQTHLLRALATLRDIGDSINQLGVDQDLPAALDLIAQGAVRVVAAGSGTAGSSTPPSDPDASAVIWVYDPIRRAFDPESRVSAGEPEGAMVNDLPRPNGMAMQAVRQRRRLLSYDIGFTDIHPAKRAAGARSVVCYPLIVGNEAVGALFVYRCDERRFSDVELLILDNFVPLAAMAIHHGQQVGGLSQALTRKMREMEKLRRASQLISSRSNLEETLQEILNIGLEMTAAQYGSFELYDKRKNLLETKALAGSQNSPGFVQVLPVDDKSIVGWVAAQRQSLRIDDVRSSSWQSVYKPLPIDREMRSELAVPILGAGGGLEGILNIESPSPNAFTGEDQQLLEALATQAVIAIQEMRLLDTMQEIVEVLLTAQYDELLKLIIERACDLINVSEGSIWLVEQPDTLVMRYTTSPDRLAEEISLSDSFTGQAVRLRQPLAIDDVRRHPSFTHPELARERGWISAIVVPLLPADQVSQPVGSLSLYATQLRDFSDWDKRLLTILANYAAVAIRDAEQLRQLKKAQERQATAETIAAVGDIAANLLHQLNNKFGAISVRVQGIEEKCGDALQARPYLAKNLDEIANSAQEAMAIVRDSMAPLQPVRSQPVDIAHCLDRALERANPPKGVAIVKRGLENLPSVLAGEKQLEMVFYNLIDNALEAMAAREMGPTESDARLLFDGAVEGDQVKLTVTDTGPGISPELQPHLFDFPGAPDKRRGGQTNRLHFGLWWVKTFVNRFDGRIEFKSEPGQGSSFTVWLPAERRN